MNKQTFLQEFDHTCSTLLELLSSFSQEQLNTVPFAGSWTAGQVGRHLQKGSPEELLYGPVRPTERQPDEKVEELKMIFLDFETRLQSPDFVLPEDVTYHKEALVSALQHTIARVRAAVESRDMSATCTGFALPTMGELTGEEWAIFYLVHIQRHIQQLKRIYKAIMGKVYA
ncbi:DinB family protein [Chitinophaga japonensis]|uniref:DinB family protein n=1 Tax=Chitinophaga japonensis TaxID=104662 RepID=A0A562SZN0_CHIJA|nr:DinB family protein [Chitinophaga japonensis]TWI86721.1 DinB family protein [Chitinophaga japonensis]